MQRIRIFLPLKQLFKTHQCSTILSSIIISLLFGAKELEEKHPIRQVQMTQDSMGCFQIECTRVFHDCKFFPSYTQAWWELMWEQNRSHLGLSFLASSIVISSLLSLKQLEDCCNSARLGKQQMVRHQAEGAGGGRLWAVPRVGCSLCMRSGWVAQEQPG